ncbi:hypothetical protein G4B88_002845 [Cannabis sativa]|uniref:BHLH domain-containing protein n=1 Tax=Cannabis sativa TaxID=3483 RepID=A0A7J6ECR9_CANSA|nr:hypothetical protein G4B88_002845 [Cannabis sativa]
MDDDVVVNPSSSSRTNISNNGHDRKITERNRRNQMKILYSNLNSLLPPHNNNSQQQQQQTKRDSSVSSTSLPDQLDEAAKYIKKLQISIERMKEKRNSLLIDHNHNHNHNYDYDDHSNGNGNGNGNNGDGDDMKLPHIEIHEMGLAVEIVLITGLDFKSLFYQTIRILHEEGFDILNASFYVSQNTVFHTIHSQKGEFASATVGASSRISERLNNFINEAITN